MIVYKAITWGTTEQIIGNDKTFVARVQTGVPYANISMALNTATVNEGVLVLKMKVLDSSVEEVPSGGYRLLGGTEVTPSNILVATWPIITNPVHFSNLNKLDTSEITNLARASKNGGTVPPPILLPTTIDTEELEVELTGEDEAETTNDCCTIL